MAIRQALIALVLVGCGGVEVVPPQPDTGAPDVADVSVDAPADADTEAGPVCDTDAGQVECSNQNDWYWLTVDGGVRPCAGGGCQPGDTCVYNGQHGTCQ